MKSRRWWTAVGALAVCAYLYGLDGQYIPKIGDEAIYLQIARVTGRSGAALPLRAETGVNDTKPPLLFWTGMASTGCSREWSLWRARLPIVLYTFALAGLCAAFAFRLSRSGTTAWLAALNFLCFHSTFQHGRPFLTNIPEAFWLFLPFYLIVVWPETPGIVLGLCVGIGLLYKSFVGAVPFALALAWHRRRLLDAKAAAAAATGLAIFLLWPALDPRRDVIFSDFFLRENFSKVGGGERAMLSGHGYLWNAFFGPYHLGRIWAGPFADAGLLALPLLAILPFAWRARRKIAPGERLLWLVPVSFMIFFSIPSQRQENYLLPAMPAAAVLLALYWEKLDSKRLAAFAAPAGLIFGLGLVLQALIPGLYGVGGRLFMLAGLAAAVFTLARPRRAPDVYHALVLAAYLAVSIALAPFDGPAGRYSPETVARLRGRVVYVPAGWNYKPRTEYYRLALPGADVRGFDHDNTELRTDLLAAGKFVGTALPLGADAPAGCAVEGRRLVVKSRLPGRDVWALLRGDLGRLLEQEAILRCGSGPA